MDYQDQKGSSMIELVFCAVIIAIAVLFIGQQLTRFSVSSEISETGERARVFSDDGLNALTSLPSSQLPAQSNFNVINNNSIEITAPCTLTTCDYIILVPVDYFTFGESIAKGLKYDRNPNSDYYLRRWKVEDVNPALNLKKITLVILPNETSTIPIRIESTIAGFNR